MILVYRTIALLLLFIYTANTNNSENSLETYFLSPPIPPTAFVGDFYTVQFRVGGLDAPLFDFYNLPSAFTGYPNGTIEGNPSIQGSFPVKVSFRSGNISSSQNLILRVVDSASVDAGSAIGRRTLVVSSPKGNLTYIVGNMVYILFEADNGKLPYIWTYTNLPAGLIADMKGTVNGTFIQEGYYTFSATVADSTGSTADSYLTVNVQPRSAINGAFVEVPIRNIPLQYNLTKVEQQVLQATRAVFTAINRVYLLQNETTSKRQEVARTTTALALAEDQQKQSKNFIDQANTAKNKATSLNVRAQNALSLARNSLELATTNKDNVAKVATLAISTATKAFLNFNQANNSLQKASKDFIRAQNESLAAALTLRQVLMQNIDAYNVYNLTFKTFKDGKDILQQQLDISFKASMIVNVASNSKDIANSVNDNAQAQLSKAQSLYTKSISALNASLSVASRLVSEFKDAKNSLGVAKFNLQQATNNLLVAQARKKEADKATAIVTMQSSTLPQPTKNQSYTFGGCEQGAYPTVAGTAQVQAVNSFGFRLASGQVVVFGDCTKVSQGFNVGDILTFVGYLKQGRIQAQSISAARI